MVQIKHLPFVLALSVTAWAQAGDALFKSTADAALKREYVDPRTSYLLLAVEDGEVISKVWVDQDKGVPLGSLVKPFVAMAYAADNQTFPQHVCHGASDRCWLPRGHGSLDLEQAIAHSCNGYFLSLARAVSHAGLRQTVSRFDLPSPPATAPETLIGLDGRWRISPINLLQAYARLLVARREPVPQRIFAGMAIAAEDGTGMAVAATEKPGRVLIKTGTAKCTHVKVAPGDGFALAMWPAEVPRYLLLVRRHGEPGSRAAQVAGSMVQTLQRGSDASGD